MKKTLFAALAAFALCQPADALTSEEIAAALGIDPAIATFSLGGDVEWTLDTETAHSGRASMKSGSFYWGDSNFHGSDLVMTINVKEASCLRYWFKNSNGNSSYDKLVAKVDSATYEDYGNFDWRQSREHVLTPGQHTIKWMHQRRYGTSGTSWIADLTIEPIMPETTKVAVTDVKCQQRYPWNGMVDIDYTVTCDDPEADIWVYPVGYDRDSNAAMAPRALSGDGAGAPVKAGTHRMTWTVTDDYPNFHSTAFTVKMAALVGAAPYMVVDVSGGVDALSYPVSYLSSVPEGGWGDEYKTTKLVLRLVPPGSFMMGSPTDENGRRDYEDLHGVVLTKPFYMGVFECTQRQYELVMGTNPSYYKGDMRPVEQVSYNNIRGSVNGSGWPTHSQVDANSFMGRLRSKANMLFDLPTEAQWEYACRAGTSSALNSGKNYDGGANCNEVARWYRNYTTSGSNQVYDGKGGYTGTTKVGCYLENAWGLYDMHGNVCEWCRDYWNYGLGYAGAIDPKGANSPYRDTRRVYRGGSAWYAEGIRSAHRDSCAEQGSTASDRGFRVMCSPVAE